jgi:hypothetical protein
MATVRLSPEALVFAQRAITKEAMRRPILSVGWSKGQMQNSRGEKGEVRWTRTQDPGWYALLSDWVEMGEFEEMDLVIQEGLDNLCVLLDGITVLVASDMRDASGTFTVLVSNGRLTLVHSE